MFMRDDCAKIQDVHPRMIVELKDKEQQDLVMKAKVKAMGEKKTLRELVFELFRKYVGVR